MASVFYSKNKCACNVCGIKIKTAIMYVPLKKVKIELPDDLPLLGIYPKKMKSAC